MLAFVLFLLILFLVVVAVSLQREYYIFQYLFFIRYHRVPQKLSSTSGSK